MYFLRLWIMLQRVTAQSFPNFDDLKFLSRCKTFGVSFKPKHINKKPIIANWIFVYFRHFISLTIVSCGKYFIQCSIVKPTQILFFFFSIFFSAKKIDQKIAQVIHQYWATWQSEWFLHLAASVSDKLTQIKKAMVSYSIRQYWLSGMVNAAMPYWCNTSQRWNGQ